MYYIDNEEANERMGWELFPQDSGGLEIYMQNPTCAYVKIHPLYADF